MYFHALSKLGVTKADYDREFKKQKGRCGICRQKPERRLNADHDHETNKFRGLLCKTCNIGLGYFKDNPALLEAAAMYLRCRIGRA